MTPHAEKTREIIRLIASCPIEEYHVGNRLISERPDDYVIFAMNRWKLTVGDVLKARNL